MEVVKWTSLIIIIAIRAENVPFVSGNILIGDFVKSRCHLEPDINSPSEFLGYPTKLELNFHTLRMLMIDDVGESLSLDASVFVKWQDDCVKQTIELTNLTQNNAKFLNLNWKHFWNPDVLITNGVRVKSALSLEFSQSLRYNIKENQFKAMHFGTYQAYCNLDFWRFPFDS